MSTISDALPFGLREDAAVLAAMREDSRPEFDVVPGTRASWAGGFRRHASDFSDGPSSAGLNALYDRYHQWLYGLFMRTLRDHENATLALGQTLGAVASARLTRPEQLRLAVARSAFESGMRVGEGRARAPRVRRAPDATTQLLVGIMDVGGDGELRRLVWRAMETLAYRERLLFELEWHDRMDVRELVTVIGGRNGQAVLDRARDRVRATLTTAVAVWYGSERCMDLRRLVRHAGASEGRPGSMRTVIERHLYGTRAEPPCEICLDSQDKYSLPVLGAALPVFGAPDVLRDHALEIAHEYRRGLRTPPVELGAFTIGESALGSPLRGATGPAGGLAGAAGPAGGAATPAGGAATPAGGAATPAGGAATPAGGAATPAGGAAGATAAAAAAPTVVTPAVGGSMAGATAAAAPTVVTPVAGVSAPTVITPLGGAAGAPTVLTPLATAPPLATPPAATPVAAAGDAAAGAADGTDAAPAAGPAGSAPGAAADGVPADGVAAAGGLAAALTSGHSSNSGAAPGFGSGSGAGAPIPQYSGSPWGAPEVLPPSPAYLPPVPPQKSNVITLRVNRVVAGAAAAAVAVMFSFTAVTLVQNQLDGNRSDVLAAATPIARDDDGQVEQGPSPIGEPPRTTTGHNQAEPDSYQIDTNTGRQAPVPVPEPRTSDRPGDGTAAGGPTKPSPTPTKPSTSPTRPTPSGSVITPPPVTPSTPPTTPPDDDEPTTKPPTATPPDEDDPTEPAPTTPVSPAVPRTSAPSTVVVPA